MNKYKNKLFFSNYIKIKMNVAGFTYKVDIVGLF